MGFVWGNQRQSPSETKRLTSFSRGKKLWEKSIERTVRRKIEDKHDLS